MSVIYVFGNPDIDQDSIAVKVALKLKKILRNIKFKITNPLEFTPNERDLVILDSAVGIKQITILENLEKLQNAPAVSLHDFDLTFNLKLLKKIGKINHVTIIAVPCDMNLDQATKETRLLLEKIIQSN